MNNVIISSLPTGNTNITAANVLAAGSVGLSNYFSDPQDLSIVVGAYMNGLRAAWIWSIALAGIAFLISFFADWKSLKPLHVNEKNPTNREW